MNCYTGLVLVVRNEIYIRDKLMAIIRLVGFKPGPSGFEEALCLTTSSSDTSLVC